MLVEFRVKNFRSFAAEQRFSMVAGSGKELPDQKLKVPGIERYSLLPSAAVLGANASGKSNLVSALDLFQYMIVRRQSFPRGEYIPRFSFLLDTKTRDEPSEFEVTFLINGIRHQYGFVVSPERVHEEWLTVYPKGKPQAWFHRATDKSGKTKWSWSRTHLRGEKDQLAERTRENALFLSVAAQWNNPQLDRVHAWFRENLHMVTTMAGMRLSVLGKRVLEDPPFREWAERMIRVADVGIERLFAKRQQPVPFMLPMLEEDPEKTGRLLEDRVEVRIERLVGGTQDSIEWGLNMESAGTNRLLSLLEPLYDSLNRGAVLVIDELDSSLHPDVTREIVRLFHDPETNPKHAQLIFTTHDSSLLDLTLFRRDQIWFTERQSSGATDLFSLDEYQPRMDEPLQKGYLGGRYGAVPVLGRLGFRTSPTNGDHAESALATD